MLTKTWFSKKGNLTASYASYQDLRKDHRVNNKCIEQITLVLGNKCSSMLMSANEGAIEDVVEN